MGRRQKMKEFLNIEVIDMAAKGKCIGKTDEGEIVIVEDAVPGDVISGVAARKKKGMWHVKIKKIIKNSPHRIEPKCQHFEFCGGCKWQHFALTEQLIFKEKQVNEVMQRIGGVSDYLKIPIEASPKEFEFRNKMEFSFSNQRWLSQSEIDSDKTLSQNGGLGLHPPGWYSKVVDIEQCHLIPNEINKVRNFIKDESRDLNLTYYSHFLHAGDMRNLITRINRKGEIMLVFVFGSNIEENHQKLLTATFDKFDAVISVYAMINQKLNDATFDLPARLIDGEAYLQEEIGHVKFNIGPKSFFQTNILQTEQVYKTVKEQAQLTGKEVVYDLYSGIGSIALYIADQTAEIVAVEDVSEAVQDARLNAQLNGVSHITFYYGKMEKLIQTKKLKDLPKPDVIITDPPRAGMHESVVNFILESGADRLIYVSCDPATQARDIRLLSSIYSLESLQAFDMFPHTSHVEAIAVLTKK